MHCGVSELFCCVRHDDPFAGMKCQETEVKRSKSLHFAGDCKLLSDIGGQRGLICVNEWAVQRKRPLKEGKNAVLPTFLNHLPTRSNKERKICQYVILIAASMLYCRKNEGQMEESFLHLLHQSGAKSII